MLKLPSLPRAPKNLWNSEIAVDNILLIELHIFSTEIHFTTGLLLKNLDIVDQEW